MRAYVGAREDGRSNVNAGEKVVGGVGERVDGEEKGAAVDDEAKNEMKKEVVVEVDETDVQVKPYTPIEKSHFPSSSPYEVAVEDVVVRVRRLIFYHFQYPSSDSNGPDDDDDVVVVGEEK